MRASKRCEAATPNAAPSISCGEKAGKHDAWLAVAWLTAAFSLPGAYSAHTS